MRLKKNLILPTLIVSVLSGCALPVNEALTNSAWAAYQEFEHDLSRIPDNLDYGRHLSDDWVVLFGNADNDEELAELKSYASYPRWLIDLHSHYEKAGGDDRCLLVNGLAFDKTMGTLAVRYVVQRGGLRASEIHYQYWENGQEPPQEAKCPDEFGLAFPDA